MEFSSCYRPIRGALLESALFQLGSDLFILCSWQWHFGDEPSDIGGKVSLPFCDKNIADGSPTAFNFLARSEKARLATFGAQAVLFHFSSHRNHPLLHMRRLTATCCPVNVI